MKISSPVLCVLWLCIASSAICQSPNTSSLIVAVLDPTGGAIKDANVSIVSGSTGMRREMASLGDGSSFFPALPLTGTYEIRVSKQGFLDQELKDVQLRAGETATLKVKLAVGTGRSEITVFGTTEGVRTDSQIGRRTCRSTNFPYWGARLLPCRCKMRHFGKPKALETYL